MKLKSVILTLIMSVAILQPTSKPLYSLDLAHASSTDIPITKKVKGNDKSLTLPLLYSWKNHFMLFKTKRVDIKKKEHRVKVSVVERPSFINRSIEGTKHIFVSHKPKRAPVPPKGQPKWEISFYALNDGNESGYGVTASGKPCVSGVTIAAPPNIPFGTKIFIPRLGWRTVEDRGGAIYGNHLDVYVSSAQKAINLGLMYTAVLIAIPHHTPYWA